jgi:hypothetical protein
MLNSNLSERSLERPVGFFGRGHKCPTSSFQCPFSIRSRCREVKGDPFSWVDSGHTNGGSRGVGWVSLRMIPLVILYAENILRQKNRSGLAWYARRATTWILKNIQERKLVKIQHHKEHPSEQQVEVRLDPSCITYLINIIYVLGSIQERKR